MGPFCDGKLEKVPRRQSCRRSPAKKLIRVPTVGLGFSRGRRNIGRLLQVHPELPFCSRGTYKRGQTPSESKKGGIGPSLRVVKNLGALGLNPSSVGSLFKQLGGGSL
jgi:hypothetical protein